MNFRTSRRGGGLKSLLAAGAIGLTALSTPALCATPVKGGTISVATIGEPPTDCVDRLCELRVVLSRRVWMEVERLQDIRDHPPLFRIFEFHYFVSLSIKTSNEAFSGTRSSASL